MTATGPPTQDSGALIAELRARLAERDRRMAALEQEADALRAEVDTERLRLRRELDFARGIQLSLLPRLPLDLPGWQLAGGYRAARAIGGDFYDVYELPARGTIGFVIADVTGKGITAALMMAFSRAVLRSAAYNGSGPADALRRCNRVLVDDVRTGLFVTVLAGELDPRSGTVRLASAGHEPPLLARASGGIEFLHAGGEMLGVFDELTTVDRELSLGPGDLLLLYTDGVTDMRHPMGALFGEARLTDTVEVNRARGAQGVVEGLLDAVTEFAAKHPAADDVTLLAIGREAAPAG